MSVKNLIIALHCSLGIISIVCICISLSDEANQYGTWPLSTALFCNVLAGVTYIILQKRKS